MFSLVLWKVFAKFTVPEVLSNTPDGNTSNDVQEFQVWDNEVALPKSIAGKLERL